MIIRVFRALTVHNVKYLFTLEEFFVFSSTNITNEKTCLGLWVSEDRVSIFKVERLFLLFWLLEI